MAENEVTQKRSAVKSKPGGYDHNEEHTRVYSAMGTAAKNTPIDRAWARLHDRGHYAGPAIGEAFPIDENTEGQHFLYAHARHDTRPSNINRTVKFHFGPQVLEESGLDDEVEQPK